MMDAAVFAKKTATAVETLRAFSNLSITPNISTTAPTFQIGTPFSNISKATNISTDLKMPKPIVLNRKSLESDYQMHFIFIAWCMNFNSN